MKISVVALIALLLVLEMAFIFWMNSGEEEIPEPAPGELVFGRDGTPLSSLLARNALLAESSPVLTNPVLGGELLRGEVRDAEGAPVPGAEIVVIRRALGPENILTPPTAPARWTLQSGPQGYFEVRTLPAAGFVVTAKKGTLFATGTAQITPGGAAAELCLVLSPAAPVAGFVRNAQGAPLKDAWVIPWSADALSGEENPYRYLFDKTNTKGDFDFALLPAGEWTFLVIARGFAPTLSSASASPDPVEITLSEGLSISGRVIDADREAPLRSVPVCAVESVTGAERRETRTDEHGRYTLKNLRPAEYEIDLRSSRHVLVAGSLHIDAGESAPDLRAVASGSIRGRVVLPEDDVRGFHNAIVCAESKTGGLPPLSINTDNAGYYRFEGLHAGEYLLWVAPSEGHVTATPKQASVNVVYGVRAHVPDFIMQPGVQISGLVVDEQGEAVADANVFLDDTDGRIPTQVLRSTDTGRFLFENVDPDATVQIRAIKMNEARAPFGPIKVGPQGLSNVRLTL